MPTSPPLPPLSSLSPLSPLHARVAGAYLLPLLEAAAARGVDAAALALGAGLAAGSLSPLPETLPASAYAQLLDAGARLSRDAHFGLHVGERVRLGTYSVYGLVLLSCRDFGQALEQTMRYEQLAHDLGRSALRRDAHGMAHYAWHSHYGADNRHLVDSVFAGIRVFGNWLAGATLPPARLALVHAGTPGDGGHAEYLRVFGALPCFNAKDNVASFDAAMLDWPLPNADVSLYPVLRRHAEQLLLAHGGAAVPISAALALASDSDEDADLASASASASAPLSASTDIVARTRAAIVAGLAQGQARLAFVAATLALSPRTLQRKLGEAGATFQQVLDQARYALARDYLRQPELSLVDIAFLLGYREQSAFHHAFKEWSGVNPGAYRNG